MWALMVSLTTARQWMGQSLVARLAKPASKLPTLAEVSHSWTSTQDIFDPFVDLGVNQFFEDKTLHEKVPCEFLKEKPTLSPCTCLIV